MVVHPEFNINHNAAQMLHRENLLNIKWLVWVVQLCSEILKGDISHDRNTEKT